MSIACYYLGAIVWSIRPSSHKDISLKETSRCHQSKQKMLSCQKLHLTNSGITLIIGLFACLYLTIRKNNFYEKSEVQCLTKAMLKSQNFPKKMPNDQEIVVMGLSWDQVWPLFYYFLVYWPFLSSNLQQLAFFSVKIHIIYPNIFCFDSSVNGLKIELGD